MKRWHARVRPLTISELNSKVLSKCGCYAAPLYSTEWEEIYAKPKRYRQITGKKSNTVLKSRRNACLLCASRFATENGLTLPAAPWQDPVVGDKWKGLGDEADVVVTIKQVMEIHGNLYLRYEQVVQNDEEHLMECSLSCFLERFDPVENV